MEVLIYQQNGTLTMEFGDSKLKICIFDAMKQPGEGDSILNNHSVFECDLMKCEDALAYLPVNNELT